MSRALTEGISDEGRTILGGDVAFSLVQREASPEEMQFFRSQGEVGVIALDARDGAAGRRSRPRRWSS